MAEIKNKKQTPSFKQKLENTAYTIKVHFSKNTDKAFKDRVKSGLSMSALKNQKSSAPSFDKS